MPKGPAAHLIPAIDSGAIKTLANGTIRAAVARVPTSIDSITIIF